MEKQRILIWAGIALAIRRISLCVVLSPKH